MTDGLKHMSLVMVSNQIQTKHALNQLIREMSLITVMANEIQHVKTFLKKTICAEYYQLSLVESCSLLIKEVW